MRKTILASSVALALLSFAQPAAQAQSNAVGGALIGAGVGAAVGGAVTGRGEGAAVGAAVGATTGAAIGAQADDRRYYRHRRHRECWRDDWGRRHCRYYRD